LSLLVDQEFGGLSFPVAGFGDGLMDPTPERPGENEVEAEASTQSLKIFWSKASLGLRRGVVVGKIGMATSHLAVER
jgi:hypothetical protein